ncbi:hemerythrin family non-heme iron protein, partial [Campylobacter coli]|nr:hemerythrin family non-heme iron protein [Campylobacter coli]
KFPLEFFKKGINFYIYFVKII